MITDNYKRNHNDNYWSVPIMTGCNYLEDVPQPFFSLLRKARTSCCRADAHLLEIQLTADMGIMVIQCHVLMEVYVVREKKQFSCLLNFLSQG